MGVQRDTPAAQRAGRALHRVRPEHRRAARTVLRRQLDGELGRACELADQAFDAYRETSAAVRADLLEAIGQGLSDLGRALVDRARRETGLPQGRIEGERGRTIGQLRLFAELLRDGRSVTGHPMRRNLEGRQTADREVVFSFAEPLKPRAGFQVLKGNLFDFAIMRTSVISDEFRNRYLGAPGAEGRFECKAVVFESPDDYLARINDPALAIDQDTILVMRGAGPVGWPGLAEVVNIQPPDALIRQGVKSLPTLGDGRQSGTSDGPSILNASPESAVGGGLAWLRTGDLVRVDLTAGNCDMLVAAEEIERRKREGLPAVRPSQTPWHEVYRSTVGQLETGACMELAVQYINVSDSVPRHNH